MNRKKIFKATLLLLIAGLLVCASPVLAQDPSVPALPHAFYGDVLINGSPAPADTKVSVTGTGVVTRPYNAIWTIVTG